MPFYNRYNHEAAQQRADDVASEMGFDRETRREFHNWLQGNYLLEKDDFDYHDLLAKAREFINHKDYIRRMVEHPEDYF